MMRSPQSMLLLTSATVPPQPIAIHLSHIVYVMPAPDESISSQTKIVVTGGVAIYVTEAMEDILTWIP